ncbi:hypothetical protein A2761_02660 [Candidatus Kaiserbacteria bacterium RIFCSPHIGHO2_01_FULL_51_33]|nr:MAG: hypothetical protein A2761_02660 [Candidatus Kaiserbacteria bacterium RIFCSPHIGHO2_01_FULL_51_33]
MANGGNNYIVLARMVPGLFSDSGWCLVSRIASTSIAPLLLKDFVKLFGLVFWQKLFELLKGQYLKLVEIDLLPLVASVG